MSQSSHCSLFVEWFILLKLSAEVIPYIGKFSRVSILAVFVSLSKTAKIVTTKITYLEGVALPYAISVIHASFSTCFQCSYP